MSASFKDQKATESLLTICRPSQSQLALRRELRDPRNIPPHGVDLKVAQRLVKYESSVRPALRDPPPNRLDAVLERDVSQGREGLGTGVEEVGEEVGEAEGLVVGDEVL